METKKMEMVVVHNVKYKKIGHVQTEHLYKKVNV